jgi:hypothetical protein
MTVSAVMRHLRCITAIVTNKLVDAFMVSEIDGTLNARGNPSAFGTFNIRRESSPVLKQDYLLPFSECHIH